MRLTYDNSADAAYLYLKYPVKKGEAKKTVKVDEDILLDFNKENKLIGIEILSAKKHLAKEVLAQSVLLN